MGRKRLTFLAACGLILAAPFETLQPWIVLPHQKLSNLEIVTTLALLMWLAEIILERKTGRRSHGLADPLRLLALDYRRPFLAPLTILIATMTLAAICAPESQSAALRFMGRFGVGFLVYLLAFRAAVDTVRLKRLLAISAIPALLVSLSGILEHAGIPIVLDFLERFRSGPSYAGSAVRAAGTLQYPTITAMYLEIGFAWVLGLLLHTCQRERYRAAALYWGILLAIGSCLILTMTRSALLIVVLLLGMSVVTVFARRARRGVLAALGLLALSLLAIFSLAVLSRPNLWLRLTTFDQRHWYQADYQVPEALELGTAQTTNIEISLLNRGLAAWTSESDPPFYLSYHWLSPDGQTAVDFEGLRTALPGLIRPGQSVNLTPQIRAPAQPGRYLLAWDMLQENRFWFSTEFSPSAHTSVWVFGPAVGSLPAPRPLPMARLQLDRFQLWRIAGRVIVEHPVLGIGPDNFRHVYGRFSGLKVADLTYHTHNLFLEFFVSAGVIGGLVFVWLTWRLLRTVGVGLRNPEPDWAVAVSPALAVVAILVHGGFDYFLEFTPTYLMIFTAIGLLEASWQIRIARPDP